MADIDKSVGAQLSPAGLPFAFPPFPKEYRASGILLPVTSLPSRFGIGDMGPAARVWIDLLYDCGQSWWQALPLGPTGYGNSPYQSFSSFAANGLLISPELLVADGLLDCDACADASFPPGPIDYAAVIEFKERMLGQVWENFRAGARKDLTPVYEQFCTDQSHWLEDYVLFRALKQKYKGAPYWDWPVELIRRAPGALEQVRNELSAECGMIRFAQFLVFRQAQQLKDYAHSKGVRLIGDLPFFVSQDSSDVWAHPECFLLDKDLRPVFVAGVPPDMFTADGQLWGNPVYDWSAMRQTDFAFSTARLRALLAHVDLIRLDHFRAFAAAWHVPAGSSTARRGKWIPGPGAEFFLAAGKKLNGLPFIAEDLGLITQDVCALRDEFHLPGSKVLQFAFDGKRDNPHRPRNYPSNSVVYTGTHDNDTTRGWFDTLPDHQRQKVSSYLRRNSGGSSQLGISAHFVHLAWTSPSALAIAPLQDLLNLGSESRINVPGSFGNNWCWRATEEMLHPSEFRWLRDLTASSRRLAAGVGSSAAGASRAAAE